MIMTIMFQFSVFNSVTREVFKTLNQVVPWCFASNGLTV
jgi:hypothetical protein